MACMMAIFSQIKIDLPGYVPITLQTFMVCLIALIAPCKVAVSACVVYLLMGAAVYKMLYSSSGRISIPRLVSIEWR